MSVKRGKRYQIATGIYIGVAGYQSYEAWGLDGYWCLATTDSLDGNPAVRYGKWRWDGRADADAALDKLAAGLGWEEVK